MPEYKVLKDFIDKDTNELYTSGSEIKLTAKRAEEVERGLENYGGGFIEKIEAKRSKSKVDNE